MEFQFNGKTLINLNSIKEQAENRKDIKITQKKAKFKSDLPNGFKALEDKEDPLTYETGMIQLPCLHEVGQESMLISIKTQLKYGNRTIRCPI